MACAKAQGEDGRAHPADPSSNLSTNRAHFVLQKALVMFEGIIKAAKNRR